MAVNIKPSHKTYSNDEERYAAIDRKMKEFDYEPHSLLDVLYTAQGVFGFISKDLMQYVARNLDVPLSRVYGVATFYDMFELEGPVATECVVCTGPVCSIAGAESVLGEVYKRTGASEPGGDNGGGAYKVHRASCLGLCDQAPAALVNGFAQVKISPADVPAMLAGEAQPSFIQVSGDPRVITASVGSLEPTDLDAHRSEGAFTALEKALNDLTPEQVIEEIKESGLAGRGGAGFPTGLKWEFARKAEGEPKYVVCNFDESEPGTFKDRVLMEGDPFRIIEGLIICAYVINANKGYIFIRGEYQRAYDIVEQALGKLRTAGLLGEDILGTGYTFDVEVRRNAGAYVCGEETAQFEAIEGRRGNPRHKPPYPTQAGLFGKPTVINNVETLAIISSLVLNGGKWFRQWGSGDSPGLKLFCLSGHVRQPGVVEAPYGLTVREMVEQYGGGFDGEPQAILVGGAAGGFLHPDDLNTPVTHEDFKELDVPVGSGALMVFNQTVDLWEVLEGLARFFVHESCGECVPCRIGTTQIYKFLQKINKGEAGAADLHKAEEIGKLIRNSCACGLGMTAANPLLSFIDHFETPV